MVGEVIQFNAGDRFQTHTITIKNDIICENATNETFFSEISLSAETLQVSVVNSQKTITIDDSNEAECCKFITV